MDTFLEAIRDQLKVETRINYRSNEYINLLRCTSKQQPQTTGINGRFALVYYYQQHMNARALNMCCDALMADILLFKEQNQQLQVHFDGIMRDLFEKSACAAAAAAEFNEIQDRVTTFLEPMSFLEMNDLRIKFQILELDWLARQGDTLSIITADQQFQRHTSFVDSPFASAEVYPKQKGSIQVSQRKSDEKAQQIGAETVMIGVKRKLNQDQQQDINIRVIEESLQKAEENVFTQIVSAPPLKMDYNISDATSFNSELIDVVKKRCIEQKSVVPQQIIVEQPLKVVEQPAISPQIPSNDTTTVITPTINIQEEIVPTTPLTNYSSIMQSLLPISPVLEVEIQQQQQQQQKSSSQEAQSQSTSSTSVPEIQLANNLVRDKQVNNQQNSYNFNLQLFQCYPDEKTKQEVDKDIVLTDESSSQTVQTLTISREKDLKSLHSENVKKEVPHKEQPQYCSIADTKLVDINSQQTVQQNLRKDMQDENEDEETDDEDLSGTDSDENDSDSDSEDQDSSEDSSSSSSDSEDSGSFQRLRQKLKQSSQSQLKSIEQPIDQQKTNAAIKLNVQDLFASPWEDSFMMKQQMSAKRRILDDQQSDENSEDSDDSYDCEEDEIDEKDSKKAKKQSTVQKKVTFAEPTNKPPPKKRGRKPKQRFNPDGTPILPPAAVITSCLKPSKPSKPPKNSGRGLKQLTNDEIALIKKSSRKDAAVLCKRLNMTYQTLRKIFLRLEEEGDIDEI